MNSFLKVSPMSPFSSRVLLITVYATCANVMTMQVNKLLFNDNEFYLNQSKAAEWGTGEARKRQRRKGDGLSSLQRWLNGIGAHDYLPSIIV